MDLSASRPGRFTTGKVSMVRIELETGWGRELMWTREKREISCPCQESIHSHSATRECCSSSNF